MRVAFDISPVNYVINHYCRQIGLEFDRDGLIARKGTVCQELLDALNDMDFYKQEGPKSLGREWVEKYVYPLIESYDLSLEDRLRTFYEHAAMQVAVVVKANAEKERPTLLITGGGALNVFLIERIAELSGAEVVIPDKKIIEYKEAIIFALLGALYMADEPSCLSAVTGAPFDNIGGMLFKI
jgi:anhydro-N-acetylmuramic acid kinase